MSAHSLPSEYDIDTAKPESMNVPCRAILSGIVSANQDGSSCVGDGKRQTGAFHRLIYVTLKHYVPIACKSQYSLQQCELKVETAVKDFSPSFQQTSSVYLEHEKSRNWWDTRVLCSA